MLKKVIKIFIKIINIKIISKIKITRELKFKYHSLKITSNQIS
jgi:hypothetical protein